MEKAGAGVGNPHKTDARSKLAEFYSKHASRKKAYEIDKQKQLQDYVAWVNTYLKRRPGVRLICDLRSFGDGITLVQLAEIVTKESISGTVKLPASLADRTANIEKACNFLMEKGVALPPDIVKDIIDGSLKSSMRAVVAIADQFLPTSVRRMQSVPRSRAGTDSSSNASSRQETSALPVGNLPAGESQKSPSPVTLLTVSSQGKNQFPVNHHQRSCTPEFRSESPIYSTPIDSIQGHSGEVAEGTRRPSVGRKSKRDNGFNPEKQVLVLEELFQSQSEVMDLKNQMLQLFALLQRNPTSCPNSVITPDLQVCSSRESQQSDSEASDGLANNVSIPSHDEQKVVSRSIDQLKEQLAQRSEDDVSCHLKKELDHCREQLKKLRSEMLRKDYKHDTEMVDAKNSISEKEVLIMTLTHDLGQHREGIGKELEQLTQQLGHSRSLQSSFLAQLRDKDAEIAILRDQLQRVSRDSTVQMTNGTSDKQKRMLTEEMDTVRSCLGSLRSSLAPQDPHQHTIDQLEHAVAGLADLSLSREVSPSSSRRHHSRSKHREIKAHGLDDSGELKYVGGRMKKQGSGEVSPGMASHSSPLSPDEVTRVVYYLDKDETPYRTTIPKRCFEVTLRDFRSAIGKSSSHKFFFKSQDPDIGAVKEEVSDSNAVVPNYDGKIICWVSEKKK